MTTGTRTDTATSRGSEQSRLAGRATDRDNTAATFHTDHTPTGPRSMRMSMIPPPSRMPIGPSSLQSTGGHAGYNRSQRVPSSSHQPTQGGHHPRTTLPQGSINAPTPKWTATQANEGPAWHNGVISTQQNHAQGGSPGRSVASGYPTAPTMTDLHENRDRLVKSISNLPLSSQLGPNNRGHLMEARTCHKSFGSGIDTLSSINGLNGLAATRKREESFEKQLHTSWARFADLKSSFENLFEDYKRVLKSTRAAEAENAGVLAKAEFWREKYLQNSGRDLRDDYQNALSGSKIWQKQDDCSGCTDCAADTDDGASEVSDDSEDFKLLGERANPL